MKPAELYKLWAPDDSIWSNWAKPVLFADHVFDNLPLRASTDWRSLDVAWAPPADGGAAVVLDLPGPESVWLAMALAQRGFRPVPLFNGAAVPVLHSALVDVYAIVCALHGVAEDLMTLRLPPNAPPVFLLDANRFSGGAFADPGHFDNRWWVFPQDFPSANFLLSQNIRSVVLMQKSQAQPRRDLAHVLLRWQEAGIQILSYGERQQTFVQDYQTSPGENRLEEAGGKNKPAPIRVEKPDSFRALWYRAMVLVGLRRNSTGGFGAIIPEPSSGGGFG
jgi:hypothetical protein